MTTINARDGQFLIDGQPVLIQAGEFHYFRTPKDQWAHRLGLLKAAGFNALACYIPWLWHELEEGAYDFDGHTDPMRDLAGFLDLAGEMGFYIIARPGPYIMAESNHEGIPAWVFEKYPQVAFLNQRQEAENVVSYLHPDFLSCARRWYQAIFSVLTPRQTTHGGRIIMVQLDNEMGMIAWVRNIIDTNPDTLARFADWLAQTYRAAQPDRYRWDGLAETLRAAILSAPDAESTAVIVEDYRRFMRVYLRDYAAFLLAEARANGMDVLPVINIHGFGNGGKTFPIGISQLVDVMAMEDIISATDVYPLLIWAGTYHQLLLVNEMTRTLDNPQQALFSIEFQAGGSGDMGSGQTSMADLHSRLVISVNMRAINHYLFVSGENHPMISPTRRHDWGHPVRVDGTTRKTYDRYPKLSRVLAAYGQALVGARNQTVATVGFMIDDYMNEVNLPATQEATRILTHQRDEVLFDFIARGLALSHRPFDALELARDPLDPARTPVLFAFMEKQCDPGVQQKLVDYVRAGGRLLLAGRMCEQTFDHQPCTLLKDALGITAIQPDPAWTQATIRALGYEDIPASFVERYQGEFGEVIATTLEGETVGFIQPLGKGRALVFGAAMTAHTLEDLDVFERMAEKLDCRPLFQLSDWADVRISRGEQGSFLFAANYLDDPVETTIRCSGEALFGGGAVTLSARRGLILPLDWQARPGVNIHYATAEITGVEERADGLVFTTEPAQFTAELGLEGYTCEGALSLGSGRVRVSGKDGVIMLQKA